MILSDRVGGLGLLCVATFLFCQMADAQLAKQNLRIGSAIEEVIVLLSKDFATLRKGVLRVTQALYCLHT